MTQEYVPPLPPKPDAPQPKSLATTSLVLGLLALIVSWLSVIGAVVSVLAVVLGIVARRKMQPQGLSVAGITTGGLGLVISIDPATTAGSSFTWKKTARVHRESRRLRSCLQTGLRYNKRDLVCSLAVSSLLSHTTLG